MNTSKLVNICIIVKKLIKVFADKLTESQQEPDDVVGFTTTAQQLAMLNTSEIPTESSGVNISETWASSSTVSCCCLHRWPLYVTAIITSYDSSNHSSDPCHLMSRGCWFRHSFHIIFTSCNFMPCKCLENWSVNFMSCNFMSCNFDGLSFSCPAFSVNPLPGAKVPRSKSSRERKFLELSLPGAKVPVTEGSWLSHVHCPKSLVIFYVLIFLKSLQSSVLTQPLITAISTRLQLHHFIGKFSGKSGPALAGTENRHVV